jgi:hypothetical protein
MVQQVEQMVQQVGQMFEQNWLLESTQEYPILRKKYRHEIFSSTVGVVKSGSHCSNDLISREAHFNKVVHG